MDVNSVVVSGDPQPVLDSWATYTNPYQNNWTYSYSFVNTVYMYQIICPKCLTTNWGEIDRVITCKGSFKVNRGHKSCEAKLKAIKEKVDYEVEVG